MRNIDGLKNNQQPKNNPKINPIPINNSNIFNRSTNQKTQITQLKKSVINNNLHNESKEEQDLFEQLSSPLKASIPKNNIPEYDISNNKKTIFTKKPKIKISRLIKIAILICIIFFAFNIYNWGDNIVRKITGGKSGIFNAFQTITSDNLTPLKSDQNKNTNILVFGTSGYDMSGKKGNGQHDGASLTDSIMAINYNQSKNQISMLNIPRDIKTEGTCTSTGKINEVYWCNNISGNNETAGADALKTEISKVTGFDFHYYVHINWGSLVSVVDSLGGIEVTLDEDIRDTWTKTFIKKGVPTKLNGEQALGLARARHGTDYGDFTRGASQQKILIAIQNKIKQQSLDFTKIMNLVNVLGDNVRTDFTIEEIKTIASMATKTDLRKIKQILLIKPGEEEKYIKTATINGISYVVPTSGVGEYDNIKKYIKNIINDNVIEESKIVVLNSSSSSGVAARERVKLENAEFIVESIGDISGKYDEKDYYIYSITDKNSEIKQKLADFYKTEIISGNQVPDFLKNSYPSADFIIIIGQKP